ncbi:unnamed protein product [Cladocopium goreaui]|uniref:Transmembrane protein n=1 Tax=Cladocopium goreaui TaxID=2562237 RepID=A0A9P1CSD2_9DINO|nr:unnamed protein product [Cladocopium goreaui]
MRTWRPLTSGRCLRVSILVLSATCIASVLSRILWRKPCCFHGTLGLCSWMMEGAGLLQLLAAREELRCQYAGSCYARRRSGLAMALLLHSLCVMLFYSDQAFSRTMLLVAELLVLTCSYQDLTFAGACPELGEYVVRAGAGAGIAWACIALCFEAQHFAKQASGSWFLPLLPLAVVRGLALAAGLAVFTKYDWAFATLMSMGLFEMSQVATLEGDATFARLCRLCSALCALGALLALRCTWRQLKRANRRRDAP